MITQKNSIYVIGNGPSLRGFDFHSLTKYDSIGMNVAFRHWHRIDWYPTYYTCLDTVMIETQRKAIKNLIVNYSDRIKLFFLRKTLLTYYPEIKNNSQVLFFEDYFQQPCFSGIIDLLTTGSFATLFVTMLGYRKIYLLGIDLNYIEKIPESKHVEGYIYRITETPKFNPNYFIHDYQEKGELYNIPDSTPDIHVKSWKAVKEKLNKFGVDVVNCSQYTKLKFFKIQKLKKKKLKNEIYFSMSRMKRKLVTKQNIKTAYRLMELKIQQNLIEKYTLSQH